MKATDFLEKQHREVEDLFEQIEEAEGAEKKAIFEEIAHKLEVHTELEEKIFYPAGREVDEDTTLEAYEEHAVVDDLIAKIRKTKVSDDTYMAKVTVLKEVVEHHVEEEEEEYFPECEKEMGDERIEELGTEMEQAYERIEARGSKKTTRKSRKSGSRSKKGRTGRTSHRESIAA